MPTITEAALAALAACGTWGGLLFGRRKADAEASDHSASARLRHAQVDELTWAHAKETIDRLKADVEWLKEGRVEREEQISLLRKQVAASSRRASACEKREKALISRIVALEAAQALRTGDGK